MLPFPHFAKCSELLSYVPRDSHAYASISTPGWFQFFQCALHLEVSERIPFGSVAMRGRCRAVGYVRVRCAVVQGGAS